VDAHRVGKLLPQGGDRVEKEQDAVEGVDPVLRVRSGVRRPAVVREVHPVQGEVPLLHVPLGRRVDHHRGVDPPEDPFLHHSGLAVARFLGGGPEGDHLPRPEPPLSAPGQDRGRARRRDPDDVVPAGVPQAGQGVHLAEERHRRTPPPEGELRAEGGLHPGNTPLDAESFFLEEGGKRAAGAGLFQRELRVGGDFPKQVDGLGLEAGGGGENGFSSRIHFSFWSLKRGRILS